MKRSTRKFNGKMDKWVLGSIIVFIVVVLLYGIWFLFIVPKD